MDWSIFWMSVAQLVVGVVAVSFSVLVIFGVVKVIKEMNNESE